MFHEIIIVAASLVVIGVVVLLISKDLKRSLQVMSGWGLYEAYAFSFDFLLWPIIQAFYGIRGIILLILIAMAMNFGVLLWYQKKKVDWFGVNVLEDIKIKGHLYVHEVDNNKSLLKRYSLYIPAKILQLMIWLLNKNDIFAFVTLSLWQDSFITTIFLRHGRFNKLDKRDYTIFILSTILSCLGWAILMQIVIEIVKTILILF